MTVPSQNNIYETIRASVDNLTNEIKALQGNLSHIVNFVSGTNDKSIKFLKESQNQAISLVELINTIQSASQAGGINIDNLINSVKSLNTFINEFYKINIKASHIKKQTKIAKLSIQAANSILSVIGTDNHILEIAAKNSESMKTVINNVVHAVPDALADITMTNILGCMMKTELLSLLVQRIGLLVGKIKTISWTQTINMISVYSIIQLIDALSGLPPSDKLKNTLKSVGLTSKVLDKVASIFQQIGEMTLPGIRQTIMLAIMTILVTGIVAQIVFALHKIKLTDVILANIKMTTLRRLVITMLGLLQDVHTCILSSDNDPKFVLKLINFGLTTLTTVITIRSLLAQLDEIGILQILLANLKLKSMSRLFDAFMGLANQTKNYEPDGIIKTTKTAYNLLILSNAIGKVLRRLIHYPKIKNWEESKALFNNYQTILEYYFQYLEYILSKKQYIVKDKVLITNMRWTAKMIDKLIEQMNGFKSVRPMDLKKLHKGTDLIFQYIKFVEEQTNAIKSPKTTLLNMMAIIGLVGIIVISIATVAIISTATAAALVAFVITLGLIRFVTWSIISTVSHIKKQLEKNTVTGKECLEILKELSTLIGTLTSISAIIIVAEIAISAAPMAILNFAIMAGLLNVTSKIIISSVAGISSNMKDHKITGKDMLDLMKKMAEIIGSITGIAATIMAADILTFAAIKPIMSMMIKIPLVTGVSKFALWSMKHLIDTDSKNKIDGNQIKTVFKNVETIIGAITMIIKSIQASKWVLGNNVIKILFIYLLILPTAILVIKELQLLASIMSKIDVAKFKKSMKTILPIVSVIGGLTLIMLSIALAIPLMIPAIIGIIPLTLFATLIIPLMIVMNVLTRIINLIANPIKSAWTLFQVNFILIILCGTAIAVITLGLLSIFASDFVKPVIIFLANVCLLLAAIALIGWVMTPIMPFIAYAAAMIVGLTAAITIISLSVLIMAVSFRLIQEIDIDEYLVMDNVKIVMGLVGRIVKILFGYDPDVTSNDSAMDTGKKILGGLARTLGSLVAVPALVFTLISTICMVAIAGMLWILQHIKLNENLIQANVEKIFGIVHMLVDKLFTRVTVADTSATGAADPENAKALATVTAVNPIISILKVIAGVIVLALSVISVLCILIIAGMLRLIQEINLDKDKIRDNIDDVIDIVNRIMDVLFGIGSKSAVDKSKNQPESPSWWHNLIEHFGKPILSVFKAIMSIPYLALTMVSIFMIAGIAMQLKMFETIGFNKTNVITNVQTIINTAQACIDAIDKRDKSTGNKSGKTWLRKLLDFVGLGDYIEAIMNIGYLAMVLASIGLIKSIADKLKYFENISKELTLATVEKSVTDIIAVANKIVALIKSTKDSEAEKAAKSIVKYAKRVTDALDAVATIVKSLQKIGSYNETRVSNSHTNTVHATSLIDYLLNKSKNFDAGKIGSIRMLTNATRYSTQYIKHLNRLIETTKYGKSQIEESRDRVKVGISAISEIISMVDGIKPTEHGNNVTRNCDLIDRISSSVGSFVKVEAEDVKNAQTITENYIKFFKQVESMDLKKLQHTDWLMRSWASISRDLKGDFEGLAKTINQHIMPMLEKVNETLEKTTKAQQDIIDVMSQPVDLNTGGGSASTPIPPSTETNPGPQGGGGNSNPTYPRTNNPGTSDDGRRQPASKTSGLPNITSGGGIDPTDMQSGKKYVVTIAGKVTEA